MLSEVFVSGRWLPYTFAFLVGLSFLIYAILDGYDLGVGILSYWATDEEKERMIGSIAPFWDANETWLVLGTGLILVAFPLAHGEIFAQLYLPVTVMLVALVFRGVSFDFRKKCPPSQKHLWDKSFFFGSLVVPATQGYMLGRFITGFSEQASAYGFATFFMLLVALLYILLGGTWLVLKTEGDLQIKAARWSRLSLWSMVLVGVISTGMAVMVESRIYEKMFSFPEMILLIMLPAASIFLTFIMESLLRKVRTLNDQLSWVPFATAASMTALGFTGLIYSFYPYIIPGDLKIVEAAAAESSLMFILIGTAIVVPVQIGYTYFAYRVFSGKATEVSYD